MEFLFPFLCFHFLATAFFSRILSARLLSCSKLFTPNIFQSHFCFLLHCERFGLPVDFFISGNFSLATSRLAKMVFFNMEIVTFSLYFGCLQHVCFNFGYVFVVAIFRQEYCQICYISVLILLRNRVQND